MKRIAAILAVTFALPAGAAEKPGIDAFFDEMAITAPAGRQSRFVAGR